MHICVCNEESRSNIRCFTQFLSTLYFETRSLNEPKDHALGQPVSLGSAYLYHPPPSSGISGMQLHTWLFTRHWGSRFRTLCVDSKTITNPASPQPPKRLALGTYSLGFRDWKPRALSFRGSQASAGEQTAQSAFGRSHPPRKACHVEVYTSPWRWSTEETECPRDLGQRLEKEPAAKGLLGGWEYCQVRGSQL